MPNSVELNRQMAGDGEVRMKVSTVAALPSTLDSGDIGAVRIVSDAGGGNVYAMVVWNGTNWIDVATGTTVAA